MVRNRDRDSCVCLRARMCIRACGRLRTGAHGLQHGDARCRRRKRALAGAMESEKYYPLKQAHLRRDPVRAMTRLWSAPALHHHCHKTPGPRSPHPRRHLRAAILLGVSLLGRCGPCGDACDPGKRCVQLRLRCTHTHAPWTRQRRREVGRPGQGGKRTGLARRAPAITRRGSGTTHASKHTTHADAQATLARSCTARTSSMTKGPKVLTYS